MRRHPPLNGASLGFRGQGTWEEIGSGKWRYRGTGQLSDGLTYANEFEGGLGHADLGREIIRVEIACPRLETGRFS